MTDTASRPLTDDQIDALVHYDAARDEIASLRLLLDDRDTQISELRKQIRYLMDERDSAQAAQQVAEEGQRAAEERTQAEADRADGAEAHLADVLIEYVIEPALGSIDTVSDGVDLTEVPADVAWSIAESLRAELGGGAKAADLAETARGQVRDWAEENR